MKSMPRRRHCSSNSKLYSALSSTICEVTGRLSRDTLINKRNILVKIDSEKPASPKDMEMSRIKIYDHFTAKQQDFLRLVKDHQKQNNYAFCRVKNRTVIRRLSKLRHIII